MITLTTAVFTIIIFLIGVIFDRLAVMAKEYMDYSERWPDDGELEFSYEQYEGVYLNKYEVFSTIDREIHQLIRTARSREQLHKILAIRNAVDQITQYYIPKPEN